MAKWRSVPCLLAVAAVSASAFFASGRQAAAQAPCQEAEVGVCFPEYASISGVARTASGYAAAAVRGDGFDILRLTADAKLTSRQPVQEPAWLANEADGRIAIQKLVAGPDDSVLVVGWAAVQTSGSQIQVGAIGLVEANGQVTWAEAMYATPTTSIILYSAVYDSPRDRFLIVGRHTNGADTGKCTFWSQGIVISVPRAKLNDEAQPYYEGAAAPGPRNRVAFYDIAPANDDGQFVVSGFATAPSANGGTCQDNIVAVQLGGGETGTWTRAGDITIGLQDANEVAFGIASYPGGGYVVTGLGSAGETAARAALVARFAFSGQPPNVQYHPYPENGADLTGGDRYRLIVPVPSGYLLAGSASARREDRNQALWQVVSGSLEPVGEARFLTRESGSDILAAAAGPDGRVLATGTHGSGSDNIGWLGIIHGNVVPVGERREPDAGLPQLSIAETVSGVVSLSEREIAGGVGVRGGAMTANKRLDFRFSLSDNSDFAAYVLPKDGDIEIALVDGVGKLVAYSSYLYDAGEYLRTTLQPGDYVLQLVAASDVPDYEIRLASDAPLEGAVAGALRSLDNAGRKALARLLESAGYGSAGNPDIAFGADTVRSVIAFYNTFHIAANGGSVEQFVASASAGSGG